MTTNKVRTLLLAVMAACWIGALAEARPVAIPSYQKLLERSALVVIATPTARTNDTGPITDFPGFLPSSDPSRKCMGVETTFVVAAVLKGDPTLRNFTLHHCRINRPNQFMVDGPSLVFFDPSDPSKIATYLLFLVREPDGRYAPTGGQTDPGVKAISKLPFPEAPVLQR